MKTEISIELLANYIVAIFEFNSFEERQQAISNLLNICYTESERKNPLLSITHLLYVTRDFAKKEESGFVAYNTDAMKDLVLTLFKHEANTIDEVTDAKIYDNIVDDVMRTVFLAELDHYSTTEKNNKTIAECYEVLNYEAAYYLNEAFEKAENS